MATRESNYSKNMILRTRSIFWNGLDRTYIFVICLSNHPKVLVWTRPIGNQPHHIVRRIGFQFLVGKAPPRFAVGAMRVDNPGGFRRIVHRDPLVPIIVTQAADF
jgi:hypothetical protein